MRIVHLSRNIPTSLPEAPSLAVQQQGAAPREQAASPHWVTLSTRYLLPPFLIITLTLTLISLLLPTLDHHDTTFFAIRPIGYAKGNVTMSSKLPSASTQAVSITGELAEKVESTIVVAGNVTTAHWLGVDGPRIFVGALQICSRVNGNESVYCTSSSKAAYHAALLPLSLGESLFSLPSFPATPVLLVISGILSLVATLVFVLSFIVWRPSWRINLLRHKPPLEAIPHRPYKPGDTESLRGLVCKGDSGEVKEGRAVIRWGSGPHPAFFCLVVAALGVAGGAMVELRYVHRARGKWNEEEADEVGLEFVLGSLTYVLPVLPVCLILILIVGAAPFFWSLVVSKKPVIPSDSDFTFQTSPSSKHSLIISEPPVAPSPATGLSDAAAPESGDTNGTRRKSWRNTFGIGVAA